MNVFSLLKEEIRLIIKETGMLEPTEPQRRAIPVVLRGVNVLLLAPAGTGKTEACMLPVFDMFLRNGSRLGVSILYITPLRALNRDMLRRMIFWAESLGISVEVRHGDTAKKVRRLQALKPPNMLITTPETLQAILPGSMMRKHLTSVRWVIIDEIHELAEDKRGIQLTLALERLKRITQKEFQRIGISSTVGSPELVARFLSGTSREIEIVEALSTGNYRYSIERPIPGESEYELAQKLYTNPEAAARILRIKEIVESHTSTLVFVNSRQNAEMLGLRFNILGKEIGVHHGSLSPEERHSVEDEFRLRKLKGVVCTPTLEMGIDVGSIDYVVQYLSPRRVSSFIQRVGRSGHKPGQVHEGTIITAYPEDTLESIAIVARALRGALEPARLHENALDVLAHQIAGLILDEKEVLIQDAYQTVRQAFPYRELELSSFLSVLELLESLHIIERTGDSIRQHRRTRRYYFENLSMIPDEKIYPIVDITTDRRVGFLGEEFVSTKAKVGLNFICRGLVWQIVCIGKEGLIYVKPVDDPTAAVPGWDGEIQPVPFEIAQEVGQLRRKIALAISNDTPDATAFSMNGAKIEHYGLRKVIEEIQEMVDLDLPVPDDKTILVEGYERFVIIHCAFGERVNRCLGYIVDYLYSGKGLIRNWWADGYRLLLELSVPASKAYLLELVNRLFKHTVDEVDKLFEECIISHFPFGYDLKFVAERFGLLPRGIFLSDEDLDELWLRNKGNPVGVETIREVKMKRVDLDNLKNILARINAKEIEVQICLAEKPSPLAYRMLHHFAEVPEMMAPETVRADILARMAKAVGEHSVRLLCLNCGNVEQEKQVKNLEERPCCSRCGSGLLAAYNRLRQSIVSSVLKRLSGQTLTMEEQRWLTEARRNADIVLSYGKKGIVALSIRGVGPQTASRILAKMHLHDEEFYRDLLDAKIRYMETRQYWRDS